MKTLKALFPTLRNSDFPKVDALLNSTEWTIELIVKAYTIKKRENVFRYLTHNPDYFFKEKKREVANVKIYPCTNESFLYTMIAQ